MAQPPAGLDETVAQIADEVLFAHAHEVDERGSACDTGEHAQRLAREAIFLLAFGQRRRGSGGRCWTSWVRAHPSGGDRASGW